MTPTPLFYKLLNNGELESYTDGRVRFITVASIHQYIGRRLAEAGGTPTAAPAAMPPGQLIDEIRERIRRLPRGPRQPDEG